MKPDAVTHTGSGNDLPAEFPGCQYGPILGPFGPGSGPQLPPVLSAVRPEEIAAIRSNQGLG